MGTKVQKAQCRAVVTVSKSRKKATSVTTIHSKAVCTRRKTGGKKKGIFIQFQVSRDMLPHLFTSFKFPLYQSRVTHHWVYKWPKLFCVLDFLKCEGDHIGEQHDRWNIANEAEKLQREEIRQHNAPIPNPISEEKQILGRKLGENNSSLLQLRYQTNPFWMQTTRRLGALST